MKHQRHSHISINMVFDMLGAAIGKSNRVATSGGITVAVFVGRECSLGVVILNSVSVFVYSWPIISWFMVWSRFVGWGMVSWSMYYWLVYNWSYVWSGVVDNWGMIWSWFVDNWGVIWSWLVDGWGVIRSRGWVIHWSMDLSVVNWSWVVWGSMMDRGVSVGWGVDWDMSWGVDSSTVLFSSIRIMYILWGSMRLASNDSVVGAMRFVDGVAYGRGIAVLDNLMARLISQGNGEKTGDCNKGLHVFSYDYKLIMIQKYEKRFHLYF